jgi:hypothetical protein
MHKPIFSCLLNGGGELTNNLHTTIVSLNTNYIIFRNVEILKGKKIKKKETSESSEIFYFKKLKIKN